MANNYNFYQQKNQNQMMHGGQGDFPSLGGEQQPNQQQFAPPQQFQQNPNMFGQPQSQPQWGAPSMGAGNAFGGFPAAAPQPAAAGGAPADNPFAASNPFASGGGGSSFTAFKPTEFKPPGQKSIMDDDDATFDSLAFQPQKNKKKTAAELAAERKKAEEEALAKLSYKGKPSSFFIMGHVPGDLTDPTGQSRVPTQEQKLFIYEHYPTMSAPQMMITQIYQLYSDAYNDEQAREQAKNAYKKPNNRQREVVEEDDQYDVLNEPDTDFGVSNKKPQGKRQDKKNAQMRAEENKERLKKKPQSNKTDVPKAAPKVVKDIDVVPSEDIVAVNENLQPASFVFIGHVDAGKSTICGNLVYLMGMVDERTIEKFKKEAKDKGRDSWWLAYVMDSSDEEKAKGKTVEVGRTVVETPSKFYTIFDAPGHKNYVPNMIMGATLADFGGLVISARRGEFEAGFEQDGQTREHIQLARSLGISKLIIVVNKMDEATVQWKKQRWDQIQENLLPFLVGCGYKESDLYWVPISGLQGDNIKERVKPEVCDWYQGPTLLEILDDMPLEPKNPEAPLRIPVLDKMKDGNQQFIFGKVEQGTVRLGDKLTLMPLNIPCQVLSIKNDKAQEVTFGRPNDNVVLRVSNLQEDQIQRGDCLCPRDQLMPITQVIEAELELLELVKPIFSRGSQCMMHLHTYADDITIKQIKYAYELDQNGEEVKKENPKFTRANARCLVNISTKTPIPIEKVDDCAPLGRFTLRDEGKTIAIGRVTRFIPFNKGGVVRATPAAGAQAAAQGEDKVAAVVFNAETGQVEQQKPALNAIAEEND